MKKKTTNLFIFTHTLLFIILFLALFLLFHLLFLSESRLASETQATAPQPLTVIIDAGHGGEDGGAVGINGAFEKDINLSIAKKLYSLLSSSGVNCIMTRSEDLLLYDRNADYEGRKKLLDMQERLRIAVSCDNAIFVSIHQNSFSVEKYSGFQVYYSPHNPASAELARELESFVRDKLQPSNKRASKDAGDSIYLLDKLTCPAVLLECGFLSNAEECERLSSDEYQTRLAEVLCDAITSFLSKQSNP